MKENFNGTIGLDELLEINKQLSELVGGKVDVINVEYENGDCYLNLKTDKFYYKILFNDLGAEIIEKMKI